METTRHIGIDLHRNKFTCCLRLAHGRNYLNEWKFAGVLPQADRALAAAWWTLRILRRPAISDTPGWE